MSIGNLITVKSALSRERRHLRQIDELKTKKKLAKNMLVGPFCHIEARFESSKLGTDTHTQSKYCNPRAHAR